jgi:arylsulfatase A-like enzyme
MLAAVDEAIGQIAATLEEQGLSNNTLIMYSSDNGGPSPGVATMNTPLRAGKGTIYEGGVRVCAFATWPGKIPEKAVITEPIHMVDWYPTLLTLTGASTTQSLAVDGLDIWPAITNKAKSPHDAILLMGTKPGHAAIRMGDWKLLLNASDKDAENAGDEKTTVEKLELYHLADDISEKNNLAATQPERVKELRARLELFLAGAVEPGDAAAEKNPKKKK